MLVTSTGFAEEAADAHKENVEKLLVLLGIPQQVNKSAADISKLYRATIDQSKSSEKVQKLVAAYHSDLDEAVYGVLGWDNIKPNYINQYAASLSPEEAVAAIEFYESGVGKQLLVNQNIAANAIGNTTKHLMEADLAPVVQKLGGMLREGLSQLNKQAGQ